MNPDDLRAEARRHTEEHDRNAAVIRLRHAIEKAREAGVTLDQVQAVAADAYPQAAE